MVPPGLPCHGRFDWGGGVVKGSGLRFRGLGLVVYVHGSGLRVCYMRPRSVFSPPPPPSLPPTINHDLNPTPPRTTRR